MGTTGAELVDFVEHQHAVTRADLAQALDDVAGQRADLGAAVAADLGLVVNATEADARELAAGRHLKAPVRWRRAKCRSLIAPRSSTAIRRPPRWWYP